MQRAYGWTRILSTGAPAPSATVTVYDTGTLNLSTIYSDNLSTPKANPFTADATSGYWFFYAASSGRYDVQFSGGGITTPYTIGDISLSGLLTLNGLTADTQTFATGTAGTNFAISSAGSTHTFNIPDASAANRGLVTTGAQTFAGVKTFSTPIAVGSGGLGVGTTPTNGQIPIGNGTNYVAAAITGTANRVTVTNGAGTITLSGPQDLAAASSPTFTGLTVSGLTANSFLYSGTAGALTTTAAPTDGQLLIGRTGLAPLAATITAGSGITVTNGAGSITIAATGALTSLNGLTASSQSFATGTSGTDFTISSATSTHTFNIPDASASARGVITTGTQTIAGAKTFSSASCSFGGLPTATAGGGSGTATLSGVFLTNTTQTGNVGAGEDLLAQFTIPASTLNANNRIIRLTAVGTGANNANNKQWRVRAGVTTLTGTVLLATGNFTTEATNGWRIVCEIIRTGASAEKGSATWFAGVTATRQNYSTLTLDTTLAFFLEITGEATANNDTVFEYGYVEIL